MKIKISSAAEFERLLDVLAGEITNAHINYRLYKKLTESVDEYNLELIQSNTFWYLAIQSLKDATLLHLCRVYDQESSSLNLVNFLKILKENVAYFSKENFQTRMKGNPFVESLSEVERTPSKNDIEGHIHSATCKNEIVKKLMIWRGSIIAHRGAKVSIGKNQELEKNPLSWAEIETLLDNALSIVNKYSSLFKASTYSPHMVGEDDYKHLLELIRLGLAAKNS